MELFEPLIICGCIFLSALSASIFLYVLYKIGCLYNNTISDNENIKEFNKTFICYKGNIYEKKD